jgi:inner membrane protein involved in colicin E2 resistance
VKEVEVEGMDVEIGKKAEDDDEEEREARGRRRRDEDETGTAEPDTAMIATDANDEVININIYTCILYHHCKNLTLRPDYP